MYGRRSTFYKRKRSSSTRSRIRKRRGIGLLKTIPYKNVRYNRGLSTLINPNPRTVFPWKYQTQMWYEAQSTVTAVAGGAITQSNFRANDIFNPANSGVTSFGYTDASGIYANYSVHAVKMEIWCSVLNTTTTNIAIAANDTSAALTFATVRSMPMHRETMVGQTAGGNNLKYLSFYIRSVDVLDVAEASNVTYIGTMGASPGNSWYTQLIVQCVDGVSAVSINVRVKLTQYLTLSNLTLFSA